MFEFEHCWKCKLELKCKQKSMENHRGKMWNLLQLIESLEAVSRWSKSASVQFIISTFLLLLLLLFKWHCAMHIRLTHRPRLFTFVVVFLKSSSSLFIYIFPFGCVENGCFFFCRFALVDSLQCKRACRKALNDFRNVSLFILTLKLHI